MQVLSEALALPHTVENNSNPNGQKKQPTQLFSSENNFFTLNL